MRVALVLGVCSAMASACVIGKRPLKTPTTDKAVVMVVSGAMPQPITEIARHAWFAVKPAGSDRWRRIEVGTRSSNPLDDYGGGDVRIHGIWTGKKAEKAIECLVEHGPAWIRKLDYLPWPGPNSNTFVDVMLRKCDLHVDLPATSIGKDYRGLLGASWTSGGTGFQIESPIVGLKLGLTEGVEIHVFGLAVGIDLWPPAIIVPLGGGRIGFDDR